MLSPGRGIDGFDRLDIRLVALLGIALLPIGLIAMVQTYRVIADADRNAEAALMGSTLAAISDERDNILRIRGGSQLAASLIPALLADPAECSDHMRDFVGAYPVASFAGYISEDGVVVCGSDGVGTEAQQSEVYQDYLASREPSISAVIGAVSGLNVIVVTQPVRIDDSAAGYVAISIPYQSIEVGADPVNGIAPIASVTFKSDGEVLWAANVPEDMRVAANEILPVDPPLQDVSGQGDLTFEGISASGQRHFYTVAPLIPGEIYSMSAWPTTAAHVGGLTAVSAVLFPLLMWFVSIGVAYAAVHRLVIRHIRTLRQRIRAFTANRKILAPDAGSSTPAEMREVAEAFHQMTQRIVRDEADLENNLHEKDVLLKEVHHRVKNNLQLIASMTSMQLRKAKSAEARFVLRRLQDRVLGLATIHRNLYQASVLSRVDSGQLVSDLVDQSLRTAGARKDGIDVHIDVESVPLYPDQAVPLALLVTETMTNALKYVGRPPAAEPWIDLALTEESGGRVRLRVENSVGSPITPDVEESSTGLGSQLMNAFVMQLDAESQVISGDESFIVDVLFQPSDFTAET